MVQPRFSHWIVRGLTSLLLIMVLVLAGCGTLGNEPADPAARVRLPKFGKLTDGVTLMKLPAGGAAMGASPELTAIVEGLRAVLATRPGPYVQTAATVLDNETLARQNQNPEYGQLLARWGRETGYFASFDLDGPPGNGQLLRASVIVSRYRAPAGAHAAYVYVVENQGPSARRYDLNPQPGARLPWDEAVIFYQELTLEGVRVGQYQLIFRAGRLIGFITNVGLPGAVSGRDTADLTQGVVERLLGAEGTR